MNAVSKRPPVFLKADVITISPAPSGTKKLRVAGYCRVSTDFAAQDSSIELQKNHYRNYILSNPDWELADIYWEKGVSGTKAETRPELQRLLADCRAGKVDLVLTKSISRFCRNTADCLTLVRELTLLGVQLRFEKEQIDTGTMGSELLLSVLAAFAQDESRSISGNMKWGIRRRFAAGTYRSPKTAYGYRRVAQQYVTDPAEAAVVRRIFSSLLDGKGGAVIARELNEERIPSCTADENGSGKWLAVTIRNIARNPFYTGDSLYQKTYTDETWRRRKNTGQLDQYLNEGDHPAIVDRETFEKANRMILRRAEEYGAALMEQKRANRYCFSGRLVCGLCGRTLYRGGSSRRTFYRCLGHADGNCRMRAVYEEDVQNTFATLLNKLVFGEEHLRLLSGLSDQLSDKKENLKKQNQLKASLATNCRKQARLYDRAMSEQFTAGLMLRKADLDAEKAELTERLAQLEGFCEHAAEIDRLRHSVMQRGIRPAFSDADAAIFSSFIQKAVVRSRESISFTFQSGLVLTESLQTQGKEARP